jgi:hypothetical protein
MGCSTCPSKKLGRSRDSGGLIVDLQYVMGYFFGRKQLNLSFSLWKAR